METEDKGCNTSTRGRFRLGGVASPAVKAVHIGAPMQRSARRVACCYGERRRSGFIRRPVVVLRECIEA